MLAIKRNEKLWAVTEKGPRQVRGGRAGVAGRQVELGPVQRGRRCQGPPNLRLDRRGHTASAGAGARGTWLLVRRSVARPEELTYYVCYAQAGTTLEELVRVAGIRWAIEECFEEAKGQVGLEPVRGCAAGMAGTGTSHWRCWPTPTWR